MFTGLIKYFGIITNITNYEKHKTITIFAEIEQIIHLGDSISVNGICLTVTSIVDHYNYSFDIMLETLSKTTSKSWKVDDVVNIEIASQYNNIRLDGHIVSGHVDCVGEIVDIKENVYFIRVPDLFKPLILDKGSIAVDGVSLTISSCYDNIFLVNIIPHTYKWTIFQYYKIHEKVNLEGDMNLKKTLAFYGDINSFYNRYIVDDNHGMYIAWQLSLKGLHSTSPNPHVGCIIVKDKRIIGMGYHKKSGDSHAEIEAINSCKEDMENCDLYVTLEPCCHVGKTGKCVDAILKYRFKRVIVGVLDTDERVCGKGIDILKNHGIIVDVLNDKNVLKTLTPYLYQRKNKKPYVYLKMATTLDNKCCARDGTSKWITNEKARMDVHKLRASVQCIVTTSKTVMNDYPKLDVRLEGNYKNPMVVVLDHNRLINDDNADVYANFCEWDKYVIWDKSIEMLLDKLYSEHKCISVMFECGSTMLNNVIEKQLWNEMHIYMATSMLGENGHDTFILKDKGHNISDLISVGSSVECEQIDDVIKIMIKK